MNALAPLQTYHRNVYSQFGEDGLHEEVLRRIGEVTPLNRWCVEFGAWDGVYLSNTCNLIRNHGYRAVLIEGDANKHASLCQNLPGDEIVKICRFVTFEGDSTLDRILAGTPIPADFDFLSIDIDGCDYYILESLQQYRPKLICIEFNPTIPNEVHYVQPRDFVIKQGCSPLSILKLAERMGYVLVATTLCNLILVRSEFREAVIGDAPTTLAALRDDSEYKVYVFSGFDGTLLMSESLQMPWHDLRLDPAALQLLPEALRKFSSDYSPAERAAFRQFAAAHPQVTVKV